MAAVHIKISLSEIEISVVFWKEAVVDDVASFVFETIVISVVWFVSKADQAVEFPLSISSVMTLSE